MQVELCKSLEHHGSTLVDFLGWGEVHRLEGMSRGAVVAFPCQEDEKIAAQQEIQHGEAECEKALVAPVLHCYRLHSSLPVPFLEDKFDSVGLLASSADLVLDVKHPLPFFQQLAPRD